MKEGFLHNTHNTSHYSLSSAHILFSTVQGLFFSKMSFWGHRRIQISQDFRDLGIQNAWTPLLSRDAATSRWVETIEDTSCWKPAASQTLCGVQNYSKSLCMTLKLCIFSDFIEVSKRILCTTNLYCTYGLYSGSGSIFAWISSVYIWRSVFGSGKMLVAHSLFAPELMTQFLDLAYVWFGKLKSVQPVLFLQGTALEKELH